MSAAEVRASMQAAEVCVSRQPKAPSWTDARVLRDCCDQVLSRWAGGQAAGPLHCVRQRGPCCTAGRHSPRTEGLALNEERRYAAGLSSRHCRTALSDCWTMPQRQCVQAATLGQPHIDACNGRGGKKCTGPLGLLRPCKLWQAMYTLMPPDHNLFH